MVGREGRQEAEESGWRLGAVALVSELSILGCRGGPLREAGSGGGQHDFPAAGRQGQQGHTAAPRGQSPGHPAELHTSPWASCFKQVHHSFLGRHVAPARTAQRQDGRVFWLSLE